MDLGVPDPENLQSNTLWFRSDERIGVKMSSREEACCRTEAGGGGLWVVMVVFGGV